MDIRTITASFVSLILFAGAAALVFGQQAAPIRSGGTTPPGAAPAPAAPKADAAKEADEDKDDEDADDEEEAITLDKAPAPVQEAALKLAGEARNITRVTREEQDDDLYVYEVEFSAPSTPAGMGPLSDAAPGTKCSASFSAAGDLVEIEKAVALDKLPASVLKALKDEFPGMVLADAVIATKITYEIKLRVDGEDHEVTVNAAGIIQDDCGGDEDMDADEEVDDAAPALAPVPPGAPGELAPTGGKKPV
jgi:hypothetical protein